MATADEAAAARKPIGADLKAGIDTLSAMEEITFTQYVKKILPLDGYVFWVRGDLVTPPQPATRKVLGSFHYATEQRQEEAESYAVNRVIFTAQAQVDFFNSVAPDKLFLATYQGIQFAFASRGNFYRQAELWHYVGNAVYSDMRSQIIDSVDDIPPDDRLIVSNSLPVWLSLNEFDPNWPFYPPMPDSLIATIYPSFLNEQNIAPPWISVHIGEDDVSPIPSAPGLSVTESQSQLTIDKVRVTLWGFTNDQAQKFLAIINQYSYDTGFIGIMNRPVIRDAKRTQNELSVIAQKKVIEYEVSYIQGNVASVARQLIHHAIPTYHPQSL